ncbi:MAG: DUF192 domain-containing protein [Candidatus Saccharimonadales bacterium]
MPKSEKAKIRSVRKSFVVYSLSFIVVAFAAWLSFKLEKSEVITQAKTCIQTEQNCFEMEVADTNEKRVKGLSGRAGLPENQGMLFIFEQAEEQCFWMKDMRFNIDMVWINTQKEIIKIKEKVSPDTFPDLFCSDNTKYVLEFNQGFVAKYGLKPGSKLQFEE